MKRALPIILTLLLVLTSFSSTSYAEETDFYAFTLDNHISKSKAYYEGVLSTNYTVYKANAPTRLEINGYDASLASIYIYKIDLEDLKDPYDYFYGDEGVKPKQWINSEDLEATKDPSYEDHKSNPMIWNDLIFRENIDDEDNKPIEEKEYKEFNDVPRAANGDLNYCINSGYIDLTEPGFYYVYQSEWKVSPKIYIIEVVDDGVKASDVPYTEIGFVHFKTQKNYNQTFKDISEEAWYKDDVINCFEKGLFEGKSLDKFDPSGNVSIAEVLAVASRIHKIYYGNGPTIERVGDTWYEGAVSYAKENLIISGDEFEDYTKAATRAELAYIFSQLLDYRGYKEINMVEELPDVDYTHQHYHSILNLYNAGIVTGSDANLTFNPDSNITRVEVAAIVNRIVDKSKRKKL